MFAGPVMHWVTTQPRLTSQCRVSKTSYIASSMNGYIFSLQVPASLMVYPGDTQVESGSSIALTCVAMGLPLPTVTWLRDGVSLNSGGSINITERVFSTTFVTSILDLCDTELNDTGLYECVTSNSLGMHSLQFDLTVQSKLWCHVFRTDSHQLL